MQAAGYFVSTAAELAASMQNGKHHLDSRHLLSFMAFNWDATAVIYNRNGIIGMDEYLNMVAKTRKCLID